MSVLRSLESKIADLVEGTFGRVFKSEVRPAELARGLAKEMDQHRTVSVSRTYVPNEYVVWLSPDDRQRLSEVEHEIGDELGAYLLEHARREKLALVSRPQVTFKTDDALNLGEFGIQARMVRASQDSAKPEPVQGDHGHTMVYSTSDRLREDLDAPKGPEPTGRAMLLAEGKRMVVPSSGAVIGRSRDCDVVLADPNVSRKHAELTPGGRGGWQVRDLGSTNGVKVNGRLIEGPTALETGDRLALGTADVRFVLE
jgi:Protein of unknown function (DUF3662)/FHA domain